MQKVGGASSRRPLSCKLTNQKKYSVEKTPFLHAHATRGAEGGEYWRAAFHLLTRTYYLKYGLGTIRGIVSRWAPESENNTRAYIENVSRLTGIDADEPIGDPKERPSRWMMVGMAMAIQENGTANLDYFAMLRGWRLEH